jgi:hypothetical protein
MLVSSNWALHGWKFMSPIFLGYAVYGMNLEMLASGRIGMLGCAVDWLFFFQTRAEDLI